MSDLIIVARVVAKPHHASALVAAQAELVEIVRKQPGCIVYELHQDEDQPGQVLFFERWRDRESWECHMQGAHMDAFRTKAGHLIGAFELMRMRQVA
jgi:quinol monooxygenase YgiN